MRRRLMLLTMAWSGAALALAFIYFNANAALPVGNPAWAPLILGGATATPTACAGGTPGPWAMRSPLSTDAFGVVVVGDGTYAYAVGGYSFSQGGPINQVSRYDPVADAWVSRAPIPAVIYDGVGVYGNNGNIYVFGGNDSTNIYNTTGIYNIGANTWSAGASMPGNRQQMGVGYYNGKIYVVGGFDTTSVSPQSQTWEYNIVSNTWLTKTAMPQALGGPGSSVIGTHLYVAGGRDTTNVARNVLYDYDLVADTWTTRANLPTGVDMPGAGTINGKLAIFGGGNPFLNGGSLPQFLANVAPSTTNITQLYDPITNIWSNGPNLNVGRSFIGGATVGQYLVAVGGYDGTTSVNTTEVSSAGVCGTITPMPPTDTPVATNTPAPATNTPTRTYTPVPSTNTPTRTSTSTSTRTSTIVSSATSTNTPISSTATRTNTPVTTSTTSTTSATSTITPGTPVVTNTATTGSATSTSTSTPTSCPIQFSDVPVGSTFYANIRCLACRGIINGYDDGTFRPSNNVTRGQLSKIVSNSANFSDPQPSQIFEDVPIGSTFQVYIGRLASRGYMVGYPCGGPGEPCVAPDNLPYFRPNNNATRGQISKIVSNTAGFSDPQPNQLFQDVPVGSTFADFIGRLASRGIMSGYPCGGPGEPCVAPDNLPYFRPNNNATRGQSSKIVANTFFPGCETPSQ